MDSVGSSPLFMASLEGHLEVVQDLLDHGAQPGLKNGAGRSPVQVAAQKNHVAVAAALLSHQAGLDDLVSEAGVLLLPSLYPDMVQLLLKARAERAGGARARAARLGHVGAQAWAGVPDQEGAKGAIVVGGQEGGPRVGGVRAWRA